jgi:hypothetical protein
MPRRIHMRTVPFSLVEAVLAALWRDAEAHPPHRPPERPASRQDAKASGCWSAFALRAGRPSSRKPSPRLADSRRRQRQALLVRRAPRWTLAIRPVVDGVDPASRNRRLHAQDPVAARIFPIFPLGVWPHVGCPRLACVGCPPRSSRKAISEARRQSISCRAKAKACGTTAKSPDG